MQMIPATFYSILALYFLSSYIFAYFYYKIVSFYLFPNIDYYMSYVFFMLITYF